MPSIFAPFICNSLDIATLFIKRPLTIRLWVFCGRLFSLGGDWVTDHSIAPDELVFQMAMLVLSSGLLVASLVPAMRAAFRIPTRSELKLYRQFKSSLSYPEYNELLHLTASTVTYAPRSCVLNEHAIPSNDKLVLLVKGSFVVSRSRDDKVIAADIAPGSDVGFIGDISFLERLYKEENQKEKEKSRNIPKFYFGRQATKKAKAVATAALVSAKATVLTGPTGAECIVFDGPALRRLMLNNSRYDVSVRALLTKGLQKKLAGMLEV